MSKRIQFLKDKFIPKIESSPFLKEAQLQLSLTDVKFSGHMMGSSAENIFLAFENSDPTHNSQYLEWMLLRFLDEKKEAQRLMVEDLEKAKGDLEFLFKHHAKLPKDKRNIMDYKSLQDLYESLSSISKEDEFVSQSQSDKVAKEGAEVWLDNKEWLVIMPTSQEAAVLYGKGTRWCTATKDSSNFDYYNRQGPLIIIINKNDKDKKTGYCKTCSRQGEKKGTGKPTYGTIQERAKAGKDYRDPKGKAAVRYANVMEKLGITKEEAIEAAREQGLVIPEEELELKVVKRGRPKKSVAVSDTDSEASVATQKKRGRPRKDKTIVSELATGDDLIAGLIKEAKKEEVEKPIENVVKKNIEPEIKAESLVSDDEEEVELEVERFTDPTTGKEYYKTDDNVLYSMESEPVGRWNPSTKEIETDMFELDDDDD